MLELNTPHLDDFTLLRYIAEDLNNDERRVVLLHLQGCESCQQVAAEIDELDRELKALTMNPDARADFKMEDLPERDPFRQRPRVAVAMSRSVLDSAEVVARALAASEEGSVVGTVILEAAANSEEQLDSILGRLDFRDPAHRFGLLYSLQESGKQIAESPGRFLHFAERVLVDSRIGSTGSDSGEADAMVPASALLGQAHQLAARSCLWSGNLTKAASHLALAYRAFANHGDDADLARIELVESQRRFFAERGREALTLARRALATLEELDLGEDEARGRVVEGMALFQLGRAEEALSCFRRALPVFEASGLWSNYVGALNTASHCLVRMGRLDEARRDYARALRRLSREKHRSWIPFIRKGLAETLFAAKRYRDAAIASSQAARLYSEGGQVSRSLMAALFEVECWARAGNPGRARHRLDLLKDEVARRGALDSTLRSLIDRALAGTSDDFREIAELRHSAHEVLDLRFGTSVF